MEETQAIDFDDLPLEEELSENDNDLNQEAGELQTLSEPSDTSPLYLGLNVVGRGSSHADQQYMLEKWKTDFSNVSVHGVFLQNNSISSTHAAIYLESGGAVCWIKDLGSRNKTMLGRAGGLTVLQSKGDRYSVLQGDKLRFGTVETVISYHTRHHQATSVAGALPASNHSTSHQATELQGHVSRSPTPDMALAQAPSVPAPTTDNDMTLPWDVPPDQQDDQDLEDDDRHPDDAAAQADIQPSDPSHQAEQPLPADTILPDTQANNMATDLQADAVAGLQSTSFAEPTQLVGAPTQLMGEPTQLALPVGPLTAAPVALPGSQAGTALASAAAQAMTGAHPSQASALPSSAGFLTAMPSLAQPHPSSQPVAGNTAGASSGLAPGKVPTQANGGPLPISRPQADAVLHLPSQPSGSQHAAHPHGAPRSPRAGQQPADSDGPQPNSAVRHDEAQTTAAAVASEEAQKGSAAAAEVGSSGHNTLLDSILGHDDDDSIWMPPASLPDSQAPSQAGAEPAGLPDQEAKDTSLQPSPPMPDAMKGSSPRRESLKAAQQTADSGETQDSEPEAKQEALQDTAADRDTAVAAEGTAIPGRTGRAHPRANEGMYTGAFAFPDSASLELSQPALNLPSKPPTKGQHTSATKAVVQGEETKAAPAAAKQAAPAGNGKAASAKDGVNASSGGSPSGRVLPSGWKRKKASPLPNEPIGASTQKPADAAAPVAGPLAGSPPNHVPDSAAQHNQAASAQFKHGAGKASPWRARGTPLEPGSGPSQAPDSEDINAAMAAVGDLAACFPSTQAEPEADAAAATAEPTAATANNEAQAAANPGQAQQLTAAPESTHRDETAAAASGSTHAPSPSADTAQPETGTAAAADTAQPEAATAAGAHSRDVDRALHDRDADQVVDTVQPAKAADAKQASKKKQANAQASAEDNLGGQGSARGRGRGRGRASGARGGGQARGRGHKRSNRDTSAEDELDTEQALGSIGAAAKGKRGRSKGKEDSPALQPTRVSKRQKAKAEAQAADAAQQEEDDQELEGEDPFSGAVTQAAAGALEDLRRSATPDEHAEEEQQPAEAAAQGPVPQPTKSGRRSSSKRTLPASQLDSVAAAELLAQGPAAASLEQSAGQPESKRQKGRSAAQGKAGSGSKRQSGRDSTASASAAPDRSHHGTPAAEVPEENDDGSRQGVSSEKGGTRPVSSVQGRCRSRLSKASSASAPEPAAANIDAAEAGPKQHGPSRRGSAKQSQADGEQEASDSTAAGPQKNSGTGSTAVKARNRRKSDAREVAEGSQATGTGKIQEAQKDAATSKASASKGRAKSKSSDPSAGDGALPLASPPKATGRVNKRGQPPSEKAELNTAAQEPSPRDPEADDSANMAPANKPKRGSRAEAAPVKGSSQQTTAAEEAEHVNALGGRSRRGSQVKGSMAKGVSQAAAAADEGEDAAGPSAQPEGDGGGASARGGQAKAMRGKRSRQSMEEAGTAGPASHVKAARKSTDSKPVRVLYSTSLDKPKRSSMTKIIQRLGGWVEDCEGPNFTHFVALQPTDAHQTDRGFKKSINALIALAAGRPIVSETWVEASGRSNAFVDPLDHLLVDKAAEKKFGFDMRTSYQRAQHQLLLLGLHVFFTPGALAGESDKGTNIKNLVEHAAGVVEAQLPKSLTSKGPKMMSQWLLIGSESNKVKDQKACSTQYAAGLVFYGRSMLIDSIMQQSLDRKHGILFTT